MAQPSVKRLKYKSRQIRPNLSRSTSNTELYRDLTGSSSTAPTVSQELLLPPPPPVFLPEEPQLTNPHYTRVHAEALAWEDQRQPLLNAYFDSLCPRDDEECASCGLIVFQEEHVRCADCARVTFYCGEMCWQNAHPHKQVPFHKPQRWEVCIIFYFFILLLLSYIVAVLEFRVKVKIMHKFCSKESNAWFCVALSCVHWW